MVTATEALSQAKKETDINLSLNNVSVVSVIEAISRETGYKFFYDEAFLLQMERITIRVRNVTLQEVLQQVSNQTGLRFRKVNDNYVVSRVTEPTVSVRTEARAQPGIRITGTVSDNFGDLMPGVTVIVRGSATGASTDANGEFSITVPSDTSVLQFSFIGFQMQEMVVGNRKIFAVTMQEGTSELGEVVVVAFGTQKRESVIASVSTVNPSELKIPSSNLTTAFAGRIAGLISYQRSGEPGQDNAEFFIRGVTTFGTGKKDPLILIDNVEMTTDDLARLNTDDIAAFSIMKDANATALYGARGANGVILVNTKEGRTGKARVQLRAEGSFSQPTQNMKLVDPVNYMRYHNEAVVGRTPGRELPYSHRKIAMTEMRIDPVRFPAIDWMDMLFDKNTFNQRYNLNVSGGGTVARYYVAAAYSKDQGILKTDTRNNFDNSIDLRKYSLRSNVNVNVTKTTEIVVRLSGVFDDYQGPFNSSNDLYSMALNANPILFLPFYEPDRAHIHTNHILFGNYGNGGYLNPYAEMVRGYRSNNRSTMFAQFELKQNLNFLLNGLSARGLFNVNRYSDLVIRRSFNPFYYALNDLLDEYVLTPLNPETGTDYLNFVINPNDGRRMTGNMYFEGALSYNQVFAEKHGVSGLVVYTVRERLEGGANTLELSLPYRNLGFAGRFTYSYDDRYFVESNFGYNGSERFHKNNRWGFFPSVGAGWVVSNESFMQAYKMTISKLKLRATHGMVGNDAIANLDDPLNQNNRFYYMSLIDMVGVPGFSFGELGNYNRPGVVISRYGDPNITWETSYKSNFGLEVNLWNELEIQVDCFMERRENIFMERLYIPSTMGLQTTPYSNIGKTKSNGFEFSADYNKVFTQEFWTIVRGTFTYATSRYDVVEEPLYENAPWRSMVGHKINQRFGYVAERLFIDDEEVANSPIQTFGGGYRGGDIKYVDINKDGRIDDNDQVPIGFPIIPEINYGFGLSVGYKSFDFSCFFQGSARSSFWINPVSTAPFVGGTGRNRAMLQYYADSHWAETNPDLFALWPRLSETVIENNMVRSTWFMRNGSFLRLKTAEIGYTLPRDIVQRVKMENMRIYVSGSNLVVWSPFKMWDPELLSPNTGNPFTAGGYGDGLRYPLQRVINIGINIEF